MKKNIALIILFLFVLAGLRCEKKKLNIPDPTPTNTVSKSCGDLSKVSYSIQVQPLINLKCLRCHDASTGFKLYDYTNVVTFANSGQLVGCLIGDQNYLQMPAEGTMDSCQIKTIVNWVHQGALNN